MKPTEKKVKATIEYETTEADGKKKSHAPSKEETIIVQVPDTLQEAVNSSTEADVLKLYTTQLITTSMNNRREELRDMLYEENNVPKPGGEKNLAVEAMNIIVNSPDLLKRFGEAAGDLSKQRVVLAEATEQAKAQREAKLASSGAISKD